ncbi:flagellar biosynthetic protein FliO [Pseudomonas sp. PA1(2017)]|uniref:flagellar biosynthetic protein FliO n=1 Tax=Pseudomonas sp. PA1(2017) TaxID=1932113 RepID=UPI000961CB74|nr:flagellar biosynthetic protein FliO [Pseudomonas sp. PA1(2017)]OLU17404.1 flagellar biosynthetic protein FliO [Pseudomonas sp. PA1(2017)]
MNRLLLALLALPCFALAAEPAAQAPAASGGVAGQLVQLVIGLLLVIGLIFLLAWMMRRVQRLGPNNGKVIKIVATQALSPRDRLVLVQVGNEQILLGLTPGRINSLHVMGEPVHLADAEPASTEFSQRLMELLGKDQKDKS